MNQLIFDFSNWPGVKFVYTDMAQTERVEQLLKATLARVRSETGRKDWEDITLIPEAVVGIVLSAAARLWANPRGLSTQQAGAFSESYGVRTASIEFTRSERIVLAGYKAKPSALMTISTTRGDYGSAWAVPTSSGGYLPGGW